MVADTLSSDVFPPPACPHCNELLQRIKETPELSTIEQFVAESKRSAGESRGKLDGDCLLEIADDERVLRSTTAGSRTWVLVSLREAVLEYHHGNRAHGHYGGVRTLDKIRRRFWWMGMEVGVKAYIEKCSVCVMERAARLKGRKGKHGKYQMRRRGEIFAIDVLSITHASSEGHMKVLVMADALTRLSWAVPFKLNKLTLLQKNSTVNGCVGTVLQKGSCRSSRKDSVGPRKDICRRGC